MRPNVTLITLAAVVSLGGLVPSPARALIVSHGQAGELNGHEVVEPCSGRTITLWGLFEVRAEGWSDAGTVQVLSQIEFRNLHGISSDGLIYTPVNLTIGQPVQMDVSRWHGTLPVTVDPIQKIILEES